MKHIQRILAVVLHPCFYPIWSILLYVEIQHPQNILGKSFVYDIFLSNILLPFSLITVGFPLGLTAMLYSFKIIPSLSLPQKKHRVYVGMITSFCYILGYYFLSEIEHLYPAQSIFGVYKTFFASIVFIMFGLTLASAFMKISIHATGLGAFVAGFMACMQIIPEVSNLGEFRLITTGLCCLIPILYTNRLSLNAHTPRQFYLGLLYGFGTMYYNLTV